MSPFDARQLDLERLAGSERQLSGDWPLAGFSRLVEDADDALPAVGWSAQAHPVAPGEGHPGLWLQLQARTTVRLVCQRCLQPYEQPLEVDRRLRFVRDEKLAQQLDEDSEDDVLVLPARLDLHALLEDELILALPLVPRHDECPEPLQVPADPSAQDPQDSTPHPFAALAALRKPGDPH